MILLLFLHHAPLPVQIAVLPNRPPIVSDHRLALPSSMHWPIEPKIKVHILALVHMTAVGGGPGPGPIPLH